MLRHFLIAHFAIMISYGVYVQEIRPSAEPVSTVVICPDNCNCSQTGSLVKCSFSNLNFSVLSLLSWEVQHLFIRGEQSLLREKTVVDSVYSIFQNHGNGVRVLFQHLIELHIIHIPIDKISNEDFRHSLELHYLNVSYNNIKTIDTGAFHQLSKLKSLNLDGNLLITLPVDLFRDLKNLKILSLRNNNIKTIKEQQLINLENLQELYLQGNMLMQIESFINIFQNLSKFDISNNSISYVTNVTVEKLKKFGIIHLGNNPLQCSCAVIGLIEVMQYNNLMFHGQIKCAGPSSLQGTRIADLDIATLPCDSAEITNVTHAVDVLHYENLVLDCTSDGSLPRSIYWLTPWGETYAQDSINEIFPNSQAVVENEFSNRIHVLSNGSLRIDTFQGYFAGEFTCVAMNLIGQSNRTVYVGIKSKMHNAYFSSLFLGAYTSSAMLGLGILIGIMRLFVQKCVHSDNCNCCLCSHDESETELEKMKKNLANVEIVYVSSSDYQDDGSEFYSSHTPPTPPVNSPQLQMSPEKCQTPDGETSDPIKVPSQPIWEQLVEVRSRLRYGAERKIEKVRSHVRSMTDTGSLKIRNFKDAGSIKIQSIKESGSHAASKVKKNVTSGMVQVKYGVKSIKEFCGTGEMGPGTISVVSVTTDVDTKERIETVKLQTFV